MGCFRKTVAVMAVLALIASSIVVFNLSGEADAADPGYFDAEVTPFTFPECEGAPILRALKQAEETIDVSIYLLTSAYTLALLIEKQNQGVKVRILIEGQPIDFDLGTYDGTRIFRNLVDAGGDVHVINYAGCESDQYTKLHNKYAVIDRETVVITSENWTAGNFSDHSDNRGWGAVVKSQGYAEYMETIFENDFDESREDVKKIMEVYPDLAPYSKKLNYSISDYTTKTYSAQVSPAVTKIDAPAKLESFISGAGTRLYSEQLNITDSFFTNPDNPYAWMLEKAGSGIDTRLVLNTFYDTEDTHKYSEKVRDINENTPIIASGSPETHSLVHNKGLVADDRSWVGSMNWTADSINDNRETSVIIRSQEISDFYAREFLLDLYSNYMPGGGKEGCKVTYDLGDRELVLTHIKGDKVILPDDPVRSSGSAYTYKFSHWEGYTEGMVADSEITITAVYDRHTVLEDNIWYEYVIAVLAVLAALALGYWYIRHGRN